MADLPAHDAGAVDDRDWAPLYRAGAISAGVAVVLYVVALVLVFVTDTPPTDPTGAEMLAFVDAHRTVYIVKQVLWLVPSLFLIVVSLALAVACWRLGRSLALVAGSIAAVSWALSFAWPTTGEGSLAMVLLADRYAAATTDAERTALIGGAETLIALNDMASPLGVLQTVGILLLGVLMLRGVFPRGLGWLGVVTGALGIVSEAFRAQLGWAYAVYGVLLFVWIAWVAMALWRLGQRRG